MAIQAVKSLPCLHLADRREKYTEAPGSTFLKSHIMFNLIKISNFLI
ncbi:hypothetical protein [Polaromonas sp. CG9_12]|nr:hypothetical protein [Polaromonas sp. CG9_12]